MNKDEVKIKIQVIKEEKLKGQFGQNLLHLQAPTQRKKKREGIFKINK